MVLDRQCAVEAGKDFPNLVTGEEGHCKQLSDTVTERKNLLPKSDLRAERDCTPTYSHAESYGISYTIWYMILRALFCKDSSFGIVQQLSHGARLCNHILGQVLLPSNRNTVSHQKVTQRVSAVSGNKAVEQLLYK